MVAEPVLATLGVLRLTYASVTDFISTQAEKLPDPALVWESTPLSYISGQNAPTHASPPLTLVEKIENKLKNHRHELFGVLGTGLGLAGLVYYRRTQLSALSAAKPRRRRAPKLANGARRDVVLVVGSPTEPMTRLLALDFEKRGFIVYLTILDEKDRRYIALNPVTDDINHVDLSGSQDLAADIAKFRHLFSVEVVPVKNGTPHLLKLSAVVFTPNLYFPLGPVENTTSASWDKVMARFSMYTKLFSLGLLDLVRTQTAKVICIIPTIVSCLRLSYHAPEAVFQNCLKDLFVALAKELRPQGISVTQVRLGNLNLANTRTLPASRSTKIPSVVEAEVRSWDPEMQHLYGAQFLKTQANASTLGLALATHGLRGLYHLLFDLIFAPKHSPSIVYYGSGARTYERIASFLPTSFVELFS